MLMISSVANVICGPNDTFNIENNAERYNSNVEIYPLRTSRFPGRKMRRIVVSEPSTSTTAIPKAAVIHHFPRNFRCYPESGCNAHTHAGPLLERIEAPNHGVVDK